MKRLDRRDWVCLLVLAVACVVLRGPSLDRVSLNPDESHYEAIASYLVSTGTSPLSSLLGEPGSFAVFVLATRLFGPYPTFELRVLVLLACLGVAWIVYGIVRRETRPALACAAGLAFLLYNLPFEGLTINREWLTVLMTAVGLALWIPVAVNTGRAATAVRFLAGVASGFALWFKLQAVFTLGLVPLGIVVLAAGRRSAKDALGGLAAFGSGVALSGVLHLLPYAVAGTLGGYLGDVLRDWRVYIAGSEAAVETAARSGPALYLRRFFLGLPHRPLLLAAYLFCAVVAVETAAWIRRPAGDRPFAARPASIGAAAWLVLALACVQMGHRFFGHYYLLMVPAVSIAAALATHWLWHAAGTRLAGRVLALLFVVAVSAEALVFVRELGRIEVRSLPIALYAAAILAVLVWLGFRPLARAGRAAAVCVAVAFLWLAWAQGTAPTPRSMSHNPYSFDELTTLLRAQGRAGDRLFVWGWAPEIYALSRLEAASYVATSEYVVQDFQGVLGRPRLDPVWVERMMRDLATREPRFIVDASRRSWTLTDMRFYRLDLYPGFALVDLLSERYDRIATADGCDVYERRGAGGSVP